MRRELNVDFLLDDLQPRLWADKLHFQKLDGHLSLFLFLLDFRQMKAASRWCQRICSSDQKHSFCLFVILLMSGSKAASVEASQVFGLMLPALCLSWSDSFKIHLQVFRIAEMRFESRMPGWETRTLPLSYAPPPQCWPIFWPNPELVLVVTHNNDRLL